MYTELEVRSITEQASTMIRNLEMEKNEMLKRNPDQTPFYERRVGNLETLINIWSSIQRKGAFGAKTGN